MLIILMNGEEGKGNGRYPAPVKLAREILDTVTLLQSRQNMWNEEMHRFFATEKQQQDESDSLTQRVQSAEAASREDGAFNDWMSRRAEQGVGKDILQGWYHTEALVSKTPFMAITPCPRGLSSGGRAEMVKAVDALELPRFLVQTVPLHLPLSKLSPTFVSSAFHVPEGERNSKSSLGALSYIGVPCTYGWDVLHLMNDHPMLAAAVDRTPCLFFNDYVPRAKLCIHCAIVGGFCVAAEVACDVQVAATLRLHESDTSERNAKSLISALSFALNTFVKDHLVSTLTGRSFRALIIGTEHTIQHRDLTAREEHLFPNNVSFFLLNLDSVDGSEFECFTQEEILSSARNAAKCRVENIPFDPIMRFLRPPN